MNKVDITFIKTPYTNISVFLWISFEILIGRESMSLLLQGRKDCDSLINGVSLIEQPYLECFAKICGPPNHSQRDLLYLFVFPHKIHIS